MSEYTITKVKSFMGSDCPGFNAELLKDGRPIASVIDAGDGGCMKFNWHDHQHKAVFTFKKGDGTSVDHLLPVEFAALWEHIKGQARTYDNMTFALDPDLFLKELVAQHRDNLAMKRRCAKSTCFRLKEQPAGEYMALSVVFSAETAAGLRKQYGERLEVIYNEKLKGV